MDTSDGTQPSANDLLTPHKGELPKEGANEGSTAPRYRRAVGPAVNYDLMGAMQFNLLTTLGLREQHFLLDIGCGSLRAGRLFIPYLLPGRYFGIEPKASLVQAGIQNELGDAIVDVKAPRFSTDDEFTLSIFEQTFDFLLAQSIFSHTSQDQIRRCMHQAAEVLAPKGLFAATFIEGDEDYEGTRWMYPGRVTYRASTLAALADEAGLAIRPIGWANPHLQRWILIGEPGHVRSLPEIADPDTLRAQLAECRGRLDRVVSNPIIRAGLRVKRMLRRPAHGAGQR